MFKPGESGNPQGRKKGVLNKKTVVWNSLSKKFIDVHSERIDIYLDELWKTNKKEFANIYVALVGYHRPKLKSIEQQIDISSLTNQQVDEIVNKIMEDGEL